MRFPSRRAMSLEVEVRTCSAMLSRPLIPWGIKSSRTGSPLPHCWQRKGGIRRHRIGWRHVWRGAFRRPLTVRAQNLPYAPSDAPAHAPQQCPPPCVEIVCSAITQANGPPEMADIRPDRNRLLRANRFPRPRRNCCRRQRKARNPCALRSCPALGLHVRWP